MIQLLLVAFPREGKEKNHWTGVRNLWDLGNYKEMESAALEVFIRLKGVVTQFWGHSGSSCSVQDVHPSVRNLPRCQGGRAEILGVCGCDSCRFIRKNFTLEQGPVPAETWTLGSQGIPSQPMNLLHYWNLFDGGFLLCLVEGREGFAAGFISSIQRRTHS